MKIYRITALSLALMLALTLISCGKKKVVPADESAAETVSTAADTETAPESETAAPDTAGSDTAGSDAAEATETAKPVPETSGVAGETSASPETTAADTEATTTHPRSTYTYSPDDELFSTPPVLGDICSTWTVLSTDVNSFIKVSLNGKWSYFTCENGEFVTKHSGMIVKGGDGYIYAEGDGEKQKIYWEDAHLCFERYGQLSETADDELLEALDASIK